MAAELMPKLPRVDVRGPKAPPVVGPVGNLLKFFRDPIGVLLALRREYGDVAALTGENAAWIAAFGAANNQAVLADPVRFENYADLPVKVPADSAPVRLNHALTSMNGDKHRRDRKLMMPAFSKSAVAGYLDETVRSTERVLSTWRAGDIVDVNQRTTELAMVVAMQCLYGLDVLRETDELADLATGFLDGLLSVGAMIFPVRIPGTPYARFLDTSERLEKRLARLIEQRRADLAGGGAKRDVLSLLVAARDDDDGSTLSDRDLLGHASVLFVAAHETTANTLAWTLFLLAAHPHIRAALDDELHGVLRGAPPGENDLQRLPLLDAVVKESMRLLPASAIMFFRVAAQKFTLPAGQPAIEFPERATVLLSSLVTHRDERVFADPQRFDPARWSTSKPTVYEYLPFGAGPRMCLGAPFAQQAVRVMLAMMLQRFRFDFAPSSSSVRVDRHVRGITLGMKDALPMRLSAREGRAPAAVDVDGDIHELVAIPGRQERR